MGGPFALRRAAVPLLMIYFGFKDSGNEAYLGRVSVYHSICALCANFAYSFPSIYGRTRTFPKLRYLKNTVTNLCFDCRRYDCAAQSKS